MKFNTLESAAQLEEIKKGAGNTIIFKHNTTCPISKSVRSSFEKEAETIPNVEAIYFLDLLNNRDLSDAIAEDFGVPHESPQLLVIKRGACVYHQAHYDITAEEAAAATA